MENQNILIRKQIGQKLRQLRERHGLSQEALGVLTWNRKGQQGRITNIESGRYRVDTDTLDDLVRAMGSTLAELFFEHKQIVVRKKLTLRALMDKQPAIVFDVHIQDDDLAPTLMKGDIIEIDPSTKPKHLHRVIVMVGNKEPIIADYLRDSKTKKFFFRTLHANNASYFNEQKNVTRIIGVVTGKRVSYL